MNKKEMYEALDKTLEAIEIGIRKEMIEFNEKLKDDVVAEFKKKVGDKE